MTDFGPGAEIAGYRIEAQIGRGGMGVVYRATQLDLGRTVALKLIAPELAQDESFRIRFQGEWRTAASIDHPNVIPLFEAGEADGILYIAMRYVSGTDLRTLIDQQGALDLRRAARLVDSTSAALDAAHERGLVHRDIKPGNVLVAAQGAREHVYLTDFGLTKQAGSTAGLTKTGHWVGTLNYVAPEQIKGERTDARADVYALGCVLFEALTGQIPFDRDSDAATMFAHMSDPPPTVTDLRPDAPPEVDEVVQRAMAKEPEDRFPSAGDLGRAALRAVEGKPQVVPERTVATGNAAPTTAAGAEPAAVTTAAARPSAEPTVAAAGEATIDAPREPTPVTTPLPSRSGRPPWLVPAIVAGVLVLAGGTALAAGVFSGGDSGSETTPTQQANSNSNPEPNPPTPEPEPNPPPRRPR